MSTFSDQPWAARFAKGGMGDASERQFLEHVEGRAERWGLERPEGVSVPHLPARVRAAPDFVCTHAFIECLGFGRGQALQIKFEKWGVLRYWNDLLPVVVWCWDSFKKRSCLISLDALDRLIQTPDLINVTYFDGRKLVMAIPAQAVFDAADRTRADL
jgi:hypothetical protein